MKTMKMTGGLAAAVAMLGLSGAAIADHGASCVEDKKLVRMIKATAFGLACETSYASLGYPVTDIRPWPSSSPLWQKKAGKYKNNDAMLQQLGCEVHESLVAKLYVPRPQEGDENVRPPKSNHKRSNDATGAANALDPENLKFDSAVAALDDFKASVDSSRPTEDPDATFPPLPADAPGDLFPNKANPSQDDWERFLKYWADIMIYHVKECGHLDL